MNESKDIATAVSESIISVAPLKCSTAKRASKPKHGTCGSTC